MSSSPSVNLVKINLLGAIKMKHFLVNMIGAAALVFGMAGTASAVTFDTIPKGATNDGLQTIYGSTDPRNGWYGAQLFLVGGPADIEVSYLGSEAGFVNEFWWGNALTPFAKTTGIAGTGVWNAAGFVKQTFTNVASGALDFFFKSPLGSAINNGTNPDPTIGQPGPNYFVSFANEFAGSGKEVILWFDDNGAGKDDNHDDMAIRIKIVSGGSLSAIPIPAALPLLLTGLFGLGLLRARRRSDDA